MRWYKDGMLWFLIGAVLLILAMWIYVLAFVEPQPTEGQWNRVWFDLGRASVGVGPAQAPAERPDCEAKP